MGSQRVDREGFEPITPTDGRPPGRFGVVATDSGRWAAQVSTKSR